VEKNAARSRLRPAANIRRRSKLCQDETQNDQKECTPHTQQSARVRRFFVTSATRPAAPRRGGQPERQVTGTLKPWRVARESHAGQEASLARGIPGRCKRADGTVSKTPSGELAYKATAGRLCPLR